MTEFDIEQQHVIERIWQKDYTLWKQDPTEISNRLDWLIVTDAMRTEIPFLKSFARDIQKAGFRYVVLLGMGGSSLGAEMLGKTIGMVSGYPELIVLDSTVPEAVKAVVDSIDVRRTLFLISSKSGTTIEPASLYRYFRNLVESVTGAEKAGDSFVAITDPGTPLAELAQTEKFRRTFLNPPDIGGRYSVLSYFGLVPAAFLGIDITKLTDRADGMREKCRVVAVQDNPGALLGMTIGVMATKGRDKLTLVTSPSIGSLGLWVEQLIAESTGKEGRGVVPVASEPVMTPNFYGDDRLFVYVRLATDDNTELDEQMGAIRDAGKPVIVLEAADNYDLGAEFYRWEFAIAVTGVLLGINPFDQPDVEEAKKTTQRVLDESAVSKRRPVLKSSGSIPSLLSQVRPGDYLGLMAYIRETPETDKVFSSFRRRIAERYNIATTLGYGPRFLHSTGQLYKGGPNSGLFIQITSSHDMDLSVPGEPYTLGVLADAEALGDMEALQAAGRRVVSVHLDVPNENITDELSKRLTLKF